MERAKSALLCDAPPLLGRNGQKLAADGTKHQPPRPFDEVPLTQSVYFGGL